MPDVDTHKKIILNDIIWSTRTKETYTNTIGAKTNKQNKQSDLGYKHNHKSALKEILQSTIA